MKFEAEGRTFAKIMRSLEQFYSNSERSEQSLVTDKKQLFADIVCFDLIYHSEKKRENLNRGKSCPPRFVKGFL